ncbi:MAG: hypothetical protein J0H30_10510 [Alphaproteobacteria bacterium]|nr:hypothetical protein [Alphaproteobacteria bacterium]
MRGLPAWKRVVGLLCDSTEVFLAGFQTISGIASDFAARLDYVRPGTSFLGGKNGTFSELFAGTATNRALLLFEMQRYTRLSFQLVQGAKEANIPMAIICDNHCYWARDFTDNVLPVSTESELFWDSQAPFLTLTNLLLDDVIARQGKKVAKRVQEMRLLQDRFEAFLD